MSSSRRIPVLWKIPKSMLNPGRAPEEYVKEYIETPSGGDEPTIPTLGYAYRVGAFQLYCVRQREKSIRDISPGDYVIFIPIAYAPMPSSGDVVISRDENENYLIRRYVNNGDGEYLISDDPSLEPVKLNEKVKIAGRAIKAWREVPLHG